MGVKMGMRPRDVADLSPSAFIAIADKHIGKLDKPPSRRRLLKLMRAANGRP